MTMIISMYSRFPGVGGSSMHIWGLNLFPQWENVDQQDFMSSGTWEVSSCPTWPASFSTCRPTCAGVPWGCRSSASTGSASERWEGSTTTWTPSCVTPNPSVIHTSSGEGSESCWNCDVERGNHSCTQHLVCTQSNAARVGVHLRRVRWFCQQSHMLLKVLKTADGKQTKPAVVLMRCSSESSFTAVNMDTNILQCMKLFPHQSRMQNLSENAGFHRKEEGRVQRIGLLRSLLPSPDVWPKIVR